MANLSSPRFSQLISASLVHHWCLLEPGTYSSAGWTVATTTKWRAKGYKQSVLWTSPKPQDWNRNLSTVYKYKLTCNDLSGPTTTKLLTIKQCPTSSLTMSHFLAICLDHSNLKRALIGSCLLARIRHNQSSISYYHHTGAFDYITNSLSWSSECHAYAVCVWVCQESGSSANGRLLSIPSQPPCKLVHL